jgi:xanthine permease XanP
MISKEPIKGDSYIQRIKGGVLGDGINSMIAGVFNTFPNTTFSQNNGVIQLTGIASKHIGVWIGVVLLVLGLFPHIGALLRTIPNSVLGGATLIMFGTVAVAGIKILSQANLNRRNMLVLAISFGVGLGVLLVPEVINTLSTNIGGDLGKIIKNVFGSSVTAGGLTAIIASLVITKPEDYNEVPRETSDDQDTTTPASAAI